eukprot:3850618-Prymnesium_polylepis.1
MRKIKSHCDRCSVYIFNPRTSKHRSKFELTHYTSEKDILDTEVWRPTCPIEGGAHTEARAGSACRDGKYESSTSASTTPPSASSASSAAACASTTPLTSPSPRSTP